MIAIVKKKSYKSHQERMEVPPNNLDRRIPGKPSKLIFSLSRKKLRLYIYRKRIVKKNLSKGNFMHSSHFTLCRSPNNFIKYKY